MSAEPKTSPSRRPSADEAKAFTLAPITPQAFGKYVLVGKLGHGGMAEVNLAITGGKGGFRKLFVVKRLHAHLEHEPGFIDMFLDEARLAAQLDHPHCVQTVEVGEANGQHFLAMEHMDGQGLERLLRLAASRGELIPPALAARIVADALDGLGYAHELVGYDGTPLRIVHRDVSPQNLFITYGGVVKVLDFGIAKATSNVVETRTGVVKGKYAYIAPEQALATPIDARADLWSMGVVFWELLTARRLFKSVNELATLQETLRGDIRPPSQVAPGIPPELDEIVMRALQRDLDLRYATAAEFKQDLERWLATAAGPSDRRAVAALMKERFGEIIVIHRQKLRDCIAAVAEGDQSVERLVGAASLASSEMDLATLKMDAASLPPGDGGTYTPSGIGPTPLAMQGVVPTPAPIARAAHAPTPILDEPTDETLRVPPRRARAAPQAEKDRKTRAAGWWLVFAGLAVVVAVLLFLRFGDTHSMTLPVNEPAAPEVVTARVIGGSPVSPALPETGTAEPVVAPLPVVVAEPTVAEPTTDRSGRGSRRDRGPRETATEDPVTPEPMPPVTAPPPAVTTTDPAVAAGTEEFGYLALATSPWTTVTWNGTSLGDTPLTHVRMPVGHHTLRLVNETEGISETYEVDIRAGETTRARLGLR